MKVAFYKGKTRIFNRLVSWWLRGNYSHCELVLSTNSLERSECVSSSFMDGGVRTKYMTLNPEHWDFVDVQANEAFVRSWLAYHEEDRYDVLGLLGFVWRRESGHQDKWFCSEAIAEALGLNESWRYKPNGLAAVLKQLDQ